MVGALYDSAIRDGRHQCVRDQGKRFSNNVRARVRVRAMVRARDRVGARVRIRVRLELGSESG